MLVDVLLLPKRRHPRHCEERNDEAIQSIYICRRRRQTAQQAESGLTRRQWASRNDGGSAAGMLRLMLEVTEYSLGARASSPHMSRFLRARSPRSRRRYGRSLIKYRRLAMTGGGNHQSSTAQVEKFFQKILKFFLTRGLVSDILLWHTRFVRGCGAVCCRGAAGSRGGEPGDCRLCPGNFRGVCPASLERRAIGRLRKTAWQGGWHRLAG